MATSRDLKRLLQPLLARRTDLAFSRRTLFFQPFTHYLRGAKFDFSRFSTTSEATAFAHQLYNGQDCEDMNSHKPHRYLMLHGWEADFDKSASTLCDEMERSVLPAVEGIVDYVEHQRHPRYFGPLPGQKVSDSPRSTFALALGECSVGDLDSAEQRMTLMMPLLDQYPVASATDDYRYSGYLFWRMAYLTRLLQTDRNKVLPLLHDWEAHAVKSMKLTKYWKPTPFPCEL